MTTTAPPENEAAAGARPAKRRRLGARDLLEANLDAGSWVSWDRPLTAADYPGADDAYLAELAAAAEKAGTDESVITGRGRIRGHDVALVVGEFRFLGGSIGRAAGERIVSAVRRATAERLPLIAATASGGTRMQEGTPAFVRMVDISRAVVDHKAAALPYLVYLRHPTTGGVFASWGSLGHVSVAEPGALIGFLGPVVYEALQGKPFPQGVQVAENLVRRGIVDAVVENDDLAEVAARSLALLKDRLGGLDDVPASRAVAARDAEGTPGVAADAWSAIELTRRPDRPGVRDLLRHTAADVVPLNGTQAGESEEALLTVLASLGGTTCVVLGQDRRAQMADRPLGPAALRSARRGMQIAQQLHKPLVCVIDTPGADLSADAEEGALASEIARCLADMVQLTVPTVSVLLGEGCGGGALALLPARRVVAAGNAWLSPLPPEGASTILFRTPDRAPEMARRQQVRAVDLAEAGVVHAVVPEEVPAHEDPVGFCRAITDEVRAQIAAQVLGGR
ncbi:acetyl-CoA carboxylase carboxyltransferase subunit alpha/beta [Nocardioides bruguierae]|uniref:Acetyl-CoA carboxylase carboxyltransferase subunit alpha/beta n=1 Tax=Nocardioides bruguierae TaxID=2945102 RepID=A0A9X2IFW2_9ACTN|nr:acetyl-CoA carboxylase carboxyltransferase subunit alpha/beta [Nocardioides bruguierae]MCM0621413.1 acetyl-CoA carboxylase carboxyltransferase subunit alpha/beta [Nocardioides bruguierae]